jgi:hypothetical protein
VLAAAVNISDNPVAWKARQGEDVWQKDAWYYYDAIGELRFATNWLANSVSLADMYVAEIDENTGLITGPTENPVAQKILRSVLGGATKRSQAQGTMALNWQIAGEVFILIRSRRGQDDEWLVLSSTEVSERSGNFSYCDPITGVRTEMNPATDLLIRIWSPHPRYQSHADSPVRAALPILKEIERTSMNIAARLDSRLAGAGVWIIPKELDFPAGDNTPAGAQGVMDALTRAAAASLSDPGQASSQVPIILDAPGDQVANFSYQTFATELTAEILELRPAGITRLAMSLDMPAEILQGMAGSNHWSAWQIEESGYKIHIAPVLDRFADALTTQYLQPALLAAGVTDVERYVFAFDTTAIVSRPDRQKELLDLHDRLLVSDEAVLSEAGVPDDDIPTDEEHDRRFVEKLVLQDTSLLADPGIREILGLPELSGSPQTVPQSTVPQIETAPQSTDRAIPERDTSSDSEGLTAAAELMVWDALSRAGGRLLTREHRGRHGDVVKHELHTVIKAGDTDKLLEGSFQFVSQVAPAFSIEAVQLEESVRNYCEYLLVMGRKHDRKELKRWLAS